MSDEFRLLMVSAMYENGGNTVHRFLDGHPQMFVYPFESQLGTRLVADQLSSVFPVKYRWPVFDLAATPAQDYQAIIDEECKVRARTPHVSKFRHLPFDFSDDERAGRYQQLVGETGRSRANNVAAFFRATFDAWKDYKRTGRQSVYVGYSPVVVVDAEKIFRELPHALLLHVVRNPWSAYADTRKRPVPLSLADYILGWTLNQHFALLFQKLFPDRMHVVRLEDVLNDPLGALGAVCDRLGLERAAALARPSWNGAELAEVYPWGTIKKATAEANCTAARELSQPERQEIQWRAGLYLNAFGYDRMLQDLFT